MLSSSSAGAVVGRGLAFAARVGPALFVDFTAAAGGGIFTSLAFRHP